MPDKCTICLDDECALFVLCEHDHAVCKECLRLVVRNFASEPKSHGVQCGAGPSAPCRGAAKPALLFHALAHTGDDHTAEINMLLKTLGSVESASAAEKAQRETEQRMLDRSEEAKTVQRLVQHVQDEVLIDKCPKCSAVFFDYDGCNAVKCSRCNEAFCAVCLQACGEDAHAHVRTKHGNLYDAPAARKARLERQRAGLAEALRDVAPEIRKQAEKILAKIMEELAVVARKECKKYGKVERDARLLSMLEELRELFAYYRSGEGAFEALPPEITLLLKSEGGDDKWCLEILHNQVAGSRMTTEERNKLVEDMRSQFGGLVYCRERHDSEVFIVRRTGRDSKKSCDILSIEWAGDVDNQRNRRGAGTIPITYMMPLARERRALSVCKALLDPTPLNAIPTSAPLEILLRSSPNVSALRERANFEVCTFAEIAGRELNAKQACVFEEHEIKKVQLIHGPPGTGKTSVVDQLLRSPSTKGKFLQGACDKHIVAVVSEKNMAIDAVAASLLRRGGGVVGNAVWEETIAHGVAGSLGKNATLFLVKSKVDVHPDVVRAQGAYELAEDDCTAAENVLRLAIEEHFPCLVEAFPGLVLEKGSAALKTEDKTITTEWEAYQNSAKKACNDCVRLCDLAHKFLPLCANEDVKRAKHEIQSAQSRLLEARAERDATFNRAEKTRRDLEDKLWSSARVFLSTLGSAHGIVDLVKRKELPGGKQEPVSMTVICDEASTVQSALFLGAFCNIAAVITNIVVIGDDRQLAPYWPLRDSTLEPGSLFADAKHVTSPIFLSEQYRAPRFVVPLLNAFFYVDDALVHARPDRASDESSALWVDVFDREPRAGKASEESELEAAAAVEAAESCLAQGQSVMLITPYRRQLAQLCRQIEGTAWQGSEMLTVCTVDGAQGQEADAVIVSLVKARPTRFLHERRMCVMLSRARSRLVLVGNYRTHATCKNRVLSTVAKGARRVEVSEI